MNFKLQTAFKPSGDQPQAIKNLVQGLKKGHQYQTLLGVTGSGKTFTIANVINQIQKPALVIVHNKTLAAQLCNEFRELFPKNAVEYFVSYYDYYQPEAYLTATDTYIEKEAQINDEIDRLRHSATQALLLRRDVIVAASVSCLYSLGAPEKYESQILKLTEKQKVKRSELMRNLIKLGFKRTTGAPERGQFRARGDVIELQPVRGEVLYRIEIEEERLARILTLNPLTRAETRQCLVSTNSNAINLFPTRHFTALDADKERAIKSIRHELKERLRYFNKHKLLLEAERIERRTNYDLEMIKHIGYCSGIENYSRHFDGRESGEPCPTLFDYFPKDYLLIIDESHATIPQMSGMYYGDFARKTALIDNGFRLPSAYDNRPLKFDEFTARVNQCIFTSATAADYERQKSSQIVEQIIRPTGLVDPEVLIRPIVNHETCNMKHVTCEPPLRRAFGQHETKSQIDDLIIEVRARAQKHERTLVTALTKKMAEDLTEHLKEQGIKANYLHSDIQTLDRIRILTNFRKGKFDCLVGVNLLREGLDLPEVTLVAILDADKEGFLRSETSLIQTIGRAARNVRGQVILYADEITGSIKRAVFETNRRRKKQIDYNKKHNITPQTIKRKIRDITKIWGIKERAVEKIINLELKGMHQEKVDQIIKQKEEEMRKAAKNLEFELAAILRDEIRVLRKARKISNLDHAAKI